MTTTQGRPHSEANDLTGQTVVITGANGDLGAEVARSLSSRGARIVLACRNLDTARQVAEGLPGESVVEPLDLSDLASVRDFADRWTEPIDVLVNNAGIMFVPWGETVDGFERTFGTNHLGHFALTGLLLEHISGRVVTVASYAHAMGSRAGLTDPGFASRRYSGRASYGASKLANLLFARELDRRLRGAGSPVRSFSAHPGVVATDLYQNMNRGVTRLITTGARVAGGTLQEGAAPLIHAATARDLDTAAFYGPSLMVRGRGVRANPSTRLARSQSAAQRLWADSERLTGVTYRF